MNMAKSSSQTELSKGYPALCDAVKNEDKEVVKVLIKLGVNVNTTDDTGVTLLHQIIAEKSRSYEIDHTNSSYPLIHFSPFKRLDVDHHNEYIRCSKLKLLLSHGANVNAQTFIKKKTPLHIAVQRGFENVVNVLLKYNADVTLVDLTDWTPFHYAIEYGNMRIIDIFLKHGVDVNIKNSKGYTLLHYACMKGDKLIINKLLENNANIHCLNVYEETPLHLVCKLSDLEFNLSTLSFHSNLSNDLEDICKSLIKLNANINAVDSARKTPLFNACSSGNFEIVRILLKYQVNVNTLDSLGRTPLHIAALKKNKGLEIVKLLLEKNANTTRIDKNGRTILHNAVTADNLDLVEMIYQFNVDINARNEEGNTALHIATQNGFALVVNSLLKNGADITIANNNGETVLYLALDNIEAARTELEKHRFNRPYNDDLYNDDWYDYNDDYGFEHWQHIVHAHKIIITMFKNYVIKLKTVGLCVDSEIINFVDSNPENEQEFEEIFDNVLAFEKDCEKEIEKLKEEKIGHLTLYDILTKNIYKVAKFTNNEKLIVALNSEYYDKIFPLYIDIIKNRFNEGTKYYKLLKTIRTCDLSDIFYGLPFLCIDKIFEYLNSEDLKIFIKTVKRS